MLCHSKTDSLFSAVTIGLTEFNAMCNFNHRGRREGTEDTEKLLHGTSVTFVSPLSSLWLKKVAHGENLDFHWRTLCFKRTFCYEYTHC